MKCCRAESWRTRLYRSEQRAHLKKIQSPNYINWKLNQIRMEWNSLWAICSNRRRRKHFICPSAGFRLWGYVFIWDVGLFGVFGAHPGRRGMVWKWPACETSVSRLMADNTWQPAGTSTGTRRHTLFSTLNFRLVAFSFRFCNYEQVWDSWTNLIYFGFGKKMCRQKEIELY